MQKNLTHTDSRRIAFCNSWNELKVIVDSIDIDSMKSVDRGNLSAGKRFRRGIRMLKQTAHRLLLESVELDKQVSEMLKENRNATT